MIVHKDYATFSILGQDINIFSEDLGRVRNTVAEIDGSFHYLGDEFLTWEVLFLLGKTSMAVI